MTISHRIFQDQRDEELAREIPVAGRYEIDPQHTTVEFVSRHLMITKVRGRFPVVSGLITVADDPELSHVEVDLAVAGVSTGIPERDRHLRSADFFDVDHYPQMTFRSTSVRPEEGAWTMAGDLTIRGVTQPVELAVTFEGTNRLVGEGPRIGFNATTEVDREAWGLTWNKTVEAGGVLVSRTVEIEINVQAVATNPSR